MTSLLQRTSWIGFERLLRAGSLIVAQLLLAQYLGLEDYGRFTALSAYIAIACVVGALGLDGGLIQKILHASGGSAYPQLLLLRLVAGILFAFVGASLVFLLWIERNPVCLLLSAGIAVCSMQDFLEAPYLLGRRLPHLLSARAVVVLLGLGAKLAAAIWVGTLEAVLAAWFAESLALAALHLWLLPSDFRKQANAVPPSWFADLSRTALPLWLSGIAICAYLRADQLIVAKLLPPEELAMYGAAQRLFEASFLVQQSLIAVLLAPYLAARQRSDIEGSRFLQRTAIAVIALSSAAALTAILSADLLVNTLFGARFSAAVPLFQNLCLALPVVAWGILRSLWIYSNRLGWAALGQNLVAAALGISLNIALIPIGGTDYVSRVYVLCVLCAFVISGFFIPSMRDLHRQLTQPIRLQR